MGYTNGKFAVDELLFVQVAPVRVLVAAVRDELDLKLLAREELANRGYSREGIWVGFKRARSELKNERTSASSSPLVRDTGNV